MSVEGPERLTGGCPVKAREAPLAAQLRFAADENLARAQPSPLKP
jgi:hypothetical protein